MSLSLALTLNAIADVVLVGGLTWFMSRPTKLTPHLSTRQEQLELSVIEPAVGEREQIAA